MGLNVYTRAQLESMPYSEVVDLFMVRQELVCDEITSLEHANELKNDQIDELVDQVNELENTIMEKHEIIDELEDQIVEKQKTIDMLLSSDNKSAAFVEYCKRDVKITKKLCELGHYAKYAAHMKRKYDALVKAGFSHDDAMSFLPMWLDDDYEVE